MRRQGEQSWSAIEVGGGSGSVGPDAAKAGVETITVNVIAEPVEFFPIPTVASASNGLGVLKTLVNVRISSPGKQSLATSTQLELRMEDSTWERTVLSPARLPVQVLKTVLGEGKLVDKLPP